MRIFSYILTFLIPLYVMAQNNSIEQKWTAIDQAMANGQFKSQQPMIDEIKALAKKSNDDGNYIKALFYEAKLKIVTSDETDNVNFIFQNFNKEINGQSKVRDAIIHMYLAKLYTLYFDENQYRINNRTNLENETSEDVRFWTTQLFKSKIDQHYTQAITSKNELLKANVKDWKVLLIYDYSNQINFNHSEDVMPTIYDVVMHDYIAYLSRDYYDYSKNNQQIKKANNYLQELAELNSSKGKFNAFLFNQLKQLTNLKQNLSSDEKLKEYENLASIYFKDAWYSSYVYLEYVQELMNEELLKQGSYRKVFEIEQMLLDKYPTFSSTKNVQEFANSIRAKTINLESEEVVLPHQNIPVRVTHKNVSKIYVRVLDYSMFNDQSINEFYNHYYIDSYKEFARKLSQLKVVDSYTIDLRSFDDYQNHTSVYKLQPLNAGRYIVLYSSDEKFDAESLVNQTYFSFINVTPSMVVRNQNEFFVTDRLSGAPIPNATIEISYTSERFSNDLAIVTDKNGIAKADLSNRNISFRLKNDKVVYSEYVYINRNIINTRNSKSAKILTDRAIYRPNQTVYYKTILYQTIQKENSVLSNKKIKIVLIDVNGREVSSAQGVTNEFGSFSGQFQLPANGLTGMFHIRAYLADDKNSSLGYHSIKVEEYKRPKFEVKVDETKNVYQINDEVEVKGSAEAFSGAKVDHAVVKYRVYRQEIFTYWPWYRSIPYNRSAKEEISFGETNTNEKGEYQFSFIAKPYEERKEVDRLYHYTVEVTVTDINGETQSTNSTIKIGDQRLLLSIDLNDRVPAKKLSSFQIHLTNINDVKQDGKGKIELYALKNPKHILRKLNFDTDYNFYSESEYKKLFPGLPYGDEHIPSKRALGQKIAEVDFDTKLSNTILLPKTESLEENFYIIKAFVYDGDKKVEIERIIYVENLNKINESTLISVATDKEEYKVGDIAKVEFKSSKKEIYVYYKIGNQTVESEGVLNLRKNNTIKIPITENHLGNVGISYFTVHNNDIISSSKTIQVPKSSRELKITTEVFRDKLKPGQKEQWRIKISGENKDKISSEVLASMYDASLDQFVMHSTLFNPNQYQSNYIRNFFSDFIQINNKAFIQPLKYHTYDPLVNQPELYGSNGFYFTLFNFNFNQRYERLYNSGHVRRVADEKAFDSVAEVNMAAPKAANQVVLNESMVVKDNDELRPEEAKIDQVQARKVLNEMAFFYPNLMTDADGNVIIDFTVPESLTEWKLMTLAHTKDLKVGYMEKRVKTQKELMVVPNAPRFLREGDQVLISTKINNLSEQTLNGTAKLMLFDPFTNTPIDSKFNLNQSVQNFTVAKGSSDQVTWTLNVPKNIQAVVYRVVAAAGDFSDGEESALPILTNRMLVTETMPIYLKENQSKTFHFKNLDQNKSKTLDHYKLTFEMTANPIWNAIFALPYLREYPYECAEQVFSRLYGNMISEKIVNSNPKIKAVFDQWNAKGELKSKLELNEELKSIILEETPWIRSAENEDTQMKQIATLFQLNQMQMEMNSAFEKLTAKQNSDGSFAWFDGGNSNEYITTHIVSGFGNLKKMNVNFEKMNIQPDALIGEAIQYLDQKNLDRYNKFKKDLKSFKNIVYSDGIHYLYARSFFLDQFPMNDNLVEMKNAMLKNLNDKKLDLSLQQKAMAALVLHRFGMQSAAKQLIISTKERAVLSDEMGMYWRDNQSGWYWYDAPVETQALLIEAYDEILDDMKSVEEMKVWLIKNKQTNQWNSTKATTKAVYALMNTGKSWIDAEKGIQVKIGNVPFNIEENSQSGSGYVKKTWDSSEIKSELGKVEVSKSSPGVTYGAMYWQYFEDLDQIKTAETGIKFNKKLFVKQNTSNGPVLKEINSQMPIKVGDVVTVRLEISVDRNMQFIHIKDMRASGFEPVNVLSGYRWNGEFGYYESTRDASTNFFADYMNKGTYVFEYDLKANNAGNFSNGITSMQNMYAPELSAHSEGIRVEIKN